MTVCIAALYDNGKGCVLVSDQMITAHFPIGYEFENAEVEKIVKVNEASVYALISGDVLFANEVLATAKKDIAAQGMTTTSIIAETIRKAYQNIRRQRVIRNELEPRGLDLTTYYQNQQRLLPQITQIIDSNFKQYNPGTELILAGTEEKGCNIFTIVNPGEMVCQTPLGYATIGSGAPHAMYSLIDSSYKKSLNKEAVEKIVKDAKKRSEVAPGVGRATTAIII